MIEFVNAKINIGLHITRRRPDGYHDLETVFYPIGRRNGTPGNPDAFCDILEILPIDSQEDKYEWKGRKIECSGDSNLVVKAVRAFRAAVPDIKGGFSVTLEKHIPDGAGLGGGSADASFTLRMLNELTGKPLNDSRLREIALTLGADCPVFVDNRVAYAEGVGERLEPMEERLSRMWCAVVKPDVYVSTKEAFAGVTPRDGRISLKEAYLGPVERWRELIVNDFEASIFPGHPELATIKKSLYDSGAVYASMSGSGSSLYGIFDSEEACRKALERDEFRGMSRYCIEL